VKDVRSIFLFLQKILTMVGRLAWKELLVISFCEIQFFKKVLISLIILWSLRDKEKSSHGADSSIACRLFIVLEKT
jgi:hypothetical protein